MKLMSTLFEQDEIALAEFRDAIEIMIEHACVAREELYAEVSGRILDQTGATAVARALLADCLARKPGAGG